MHRGRAAAVRRFRLTARLSEVNSPPVRSTDGHRHSSRPTKGRPFSCAGSVGHERVVIRSNQVESEPGGDPVALPGV